MRDQYQFLFVVMVLAAASLGCSLSSFLPGSGPVLDEDFSGESNWGTGTDDSSSIEYADDGLQMKIFTDNYFIWSTPNAESYENIHIEVTVKNNNTPATTAFGILCNQQTISDSFYYLVMTPAGEYAIAETSLTQSDVFLTNNDQWAQSDSIAANAPSYRLGADCGNGTLTMYVDGQQIASVSDDTYTAGSVGLLVWSGEDVATADVTFDDFVVTKLQQP
jgi:hypothetical protein